ncbi:thioredoxin family protein [Lacticaseibacillus daqingensis]|uniref:thioredoxin family protein n=1 Tax=Lacticaseibacillus daqingensis TaxID=2486014 RepID=UPI000F781B34|nr:thioredoxin family protein [Lacticaseibacillus daqingensis]
MKPRAVPLLGVSLGLLLALTGCGRQTTAGASASSATGSVTTSQRWAYDNAVARLKPVTTKTIKSIPDGSFVFFGRPTCPYCRAFVPKLADALTQVHVTDIYYFNTDEHDQTNYQATRDAYGIELVPNLIQIHQGQVSHYDFKSSLTDFLAR